MATLIRDCVISDTDPAYVGSWAGDVDTPLCEPDTCYFCKIGQKDHAVGFLADGDTRYGTCQRHRRRVAPGGKPARFRRYALKSAPVVDIPAADVRRGMALLIPAYLGTTALRLAPVKKVVRNGTNRQIHFHTCYHAVNQESVFQRVLTRITK